MRRLRGSRVGGVIFLLKVSVVLGCFGWMVGGGFGCEGIDGDGSDDGGGNGA